MADTYGKISDDFVRFIWMAAQSASTNLCLSEPPSAEASPALQDDYATVRLFIFSLSCADRSTFGKGRRRAISSG
jgi:hypothetical protein